MLLSGDARGSIMRPSIRSASRAGACAAAILIPLAAFAAEKLERPPSFDAGRLPQIKATGENYVIATPVGSDGFLRKYLIKTPYGDLPAHGDAMARMRLGELAALHELEKLSQSEAFGKRLVEAGLSPLKYTGQLITNPGETISNTFSGIGQRLSQFGSGVANFGKSTGDTDNPIAGMLGVSQQKRELAARLGVDPYTDFQALNEKMTRLSEAGASGGLTVSAAFMVIPGVGGAIVSGVASGSNLSNLARDYSAAQLLDLNRQKLADMSVEPGIADALLANRSYTPLDVAAMLVALESMADVEGRTGFIARATSVSDRDRAYFMRRQAELLAAHHTKTGALVRFVWVGDFPFNEVRTGGVVGVWPVDALSWTDGTSRLWQDLIARLKQRGRPRMELRITGQATSLARQRFKALGWGLVENARL